MDKFDKREVEVSSLYSKNLYKSVFQVKPKVKLSFDQNKFTATYKCKINIAEASLLMINFFSYSHLLDCIQLVVTTADNERRDVKLNYELPNKLYRVSNSPRHKGEAKHEYFQKFKLQPNNYVFNFQFTVFKNCLEDETINFLLKIGSVSECTFEELECEN